MANNEIKILLLNLKFLRQAIKKKAPIIKESKNHKKFALSSILKFSPGGFKIYLSFPCHNIYSDNSNNSQNTFEHLVKYYLG